MGLIRIRRLQLETLVGVHPHERQAPQFVFVDLELEVDDAACQSDDLGDAVDYEALANTLRATAAASACLLIERLAGLLLADVMAVSGVRRATLVLAKPGALPLAEQVEFELSARR